MEISTLKKINRFALAEMRTHKKISIIMNIILGMGAALYLLIRPYRVSYSFSTPDEVNYFSPSPLAMFLFVVSCGIGIVAAVSVFRDMNNTQICDVQMSLPMSANERFFSKLLALGYLHIFPILVYCGVSSLICGIICSVNNVQNSSEVLSLFLVIMAVALFTDCITVLSACCCGALAESVYFTVILLFCLSIAPECIWERLINSFSGLGIGFYEIPIFSLWTYSGILAAYSGILESVGSGNIYLLINCLISIAVLFLSLLIYRRRDARTVGTPIVSRAFFEFVLLLGVFTVYSLFFFETFAYVGLILVGIIYVVIHIIVSRAKITPAKFFIWVAKYGICTALYVVVAMVAYFTSGFGMVYYKPTESLEHCAAYISLNYLNEDATGKYTSEYSIGVNKDRLPSEVSDEQMREVLNIFQSAYARRQKSLKEFIEILNGNSNYSSSMFGYRAGDTNTIHIYKSMPYKANNEYTYGHYDEFYYDYDYDESENLNKYYYESIFDQEVYFDYATAQALIDEINNSGLFVLENRDYIDFDSGDNYTEDYYID